LLKQRVISGIVLASIAVGILYFDNFLAPWYPFLLIATLLMAYLGTKEMLSMMPETIRPFTKLTYIVVYGCILVNWLPTINTFLKTPFTITIWPTIIGFIVVSFLVTFCLGLRTFTQPGGHIPRIGLTLFALMYLGILTTFFMQLRWLSPENGGMLMLLTIFTPKCGDIGAYFAGKAFGKHKMTPVLSPGKTWEGFVGGLLGSVGCVLLSLLIGAKFKYGITEAILFGLTISVTGIIGDLAESLIKRDIGTKDAAKSIPGFGGLLDVVDSVLFSSPFIYAWFSLTGSMC
jgi:phosphatidate cytidylyltransferase